MPQASTEQVHRVCKLIGEVLAIPESKMTMQSRIMDDLQAESIDLLDLRFRLEREFEITISNDDLRRAFEGLTSAEAFRAAFTVGALCDYIARRVEQRIG
jgi:acyl carrier protein